MKHAIAAVVVTATLAVPVLAESHEGHPAQDARNAHMSLYGFNLGQLGPMAKGEVEYDADAAAAFAANIARLAGMDERAYWPEGTSSEDDPESRALPIIWNQMDEFMAISASLEADAEALQAAAANGIDAFRPAFGKMAANCGACHRTYRAPE